MKRRFTSLALICLLGVGGWFLLSFRPAHSRLGELRADVEKTRVEVSDLEAKLTRLLALQRNVGGSRDEANRRLAALPTDPKVSDFIIRVQDAANAAGIDFLSISPSLPAVAAGAEASAPQASGSTQGSASSATPTPGQSADAPTQATPASRLRSISVQIKADGEYFEIERFVLTLEQLARALRIDDFSLSTGGDEQGGTRLSAAVKLQLFMLAPQAAAGAASPGQTVQGTSEAA